MTKDAPAFDLPSVLDAAARLSSEHGVKVRVSRSGAITIDPPAEDGQRATSTERVRRFRDAKRMKQGNAGNAGNVETHETHETHETEVKRFVDPASPSPSLPPSPLSPTPPIPTPSHASPPVHPSGEPARKAAELPDEKWLKSLSADPAYAGLNVQGEFGKMQRWCEVNRKQPSRRRFVNWLNHAERPMATTGNLFTKPLRPADKSDVKATNMREL